jgi:hypothetical protein
MKPGVEALALDEILTGGLVGGHHHLVTGVLAQPVLAGLLRAPILQRGELGELGDVVDPLVDLVALDRDDRPVDEVVLDQQGDQCERQVGVVCHHEALGDEQAVFGGNLDAHRVDATLDWFD